MTGSRVCMVLAGAAAVLGALTAVVVATGAVSGVPANEIAIALAITTYAVLAGVIELARPGHRVGRLMLTGATSWGVGEGALALGLQGYLHDPGSVPGAEWLAVTGTAVRGFGWLMLILAVPLFFPDGELPWRGRRSPAVIVLVLGSIAGFTAASLLAPTPLEFRLEGMDSPTGLPASMRLVTDVLALTALALCVVALAVAVAGLVHRWQGGDELRRQQLLWLCIAFAVPILFLPFIATDSVAPWMFAVVTLPVPVAIAVAMLQRRLYDVQIALSRSLTYLALSAVVAGLYALTVGGVGALLRERGAVWLPWVAAGVVAVSFAPLRNVLQHAVNRLTYGQWSQPADVLAATGRRLADASDVSGLVNTLVVELGTGLDLAYVEIRDAAGRPLACHGTVDADQLEEIPLTAYGAPVGALRWSRRRLREADRRLLDDLAHQLGGVVHASGLFDTIREAQHRLVLAREEERRRLRRDLHDGLGPALASLTLQVDTLRNRLGTNETDPDADLLRLRSAIQATVVDVRRIVEGLRPPALDELGLAGALEDLGTRTAAHGLKVELDVPPLPQVPAAVEVAILRVTQEALTNVVRHSGATRADMRITLHSNGISLEITDDGAGTASSRIGGIGLTSMRERAEEISGTLTVDSTPGRGTRIRMWLPVRADLPQQAVVVAP
ncbi:MAG: sensor histidine kinase [Nocardioidaceae bacterium]